MASVGERGQVGGGGPIGVSGEGVSSPEPRPQEVDDDRKNKADLFGGARAAGA